VGGTVLQVSDTHLCAGSALGDEQWESVLALVGEEPPDLVVHTGDISMDGARRPADLSHAKAQLDRLTVPWVAVAGNHDIGDVGATTMPIDAGRVERFGAVFGSSFWVRPLDGWRLVGADSQLLGSPLPDAEERWGWLAEALGGGGQTALFLHRPLFRERRDEPLDEPARYVDVEFRRRLLALLDEGDVRLVASGHVHQWLTLDEGGRRYVWAPSTWAVLPDSVQPLIGAKTTGVVLHRLARDAVTSELVRPPGMAFARIDEDPY
jgi:3',5'-cyclic AMP phosphodiesterase CpdA